MLCGRKLGSMKVAMAVVLCTIAGCGGGSSAGSDASEVSKLRAMHMMYARYLGEHNNTPPPDEAAFRKFVSDHPQHLESAQVSVDEIFVSPRSGEPFRWAYGRTRLVDKNGGTYYGYEATPTDNKRLVIGERGFREIDESQFRELFPDAP